MSYIQNIKIGKKTTKVLESVTNSNEIIQKFGANCLIITMYNAV